MELQRSEQFLDITVREPSYSLRLAAQYGERWGRIELEHLMFEILLHQELKREQLRHMGKYEKCIKLELFVVNVFIKSAQQ